MAVGAYNRKFKNPKTRADWVTSDEEHLEKYISDYELIKFYVDPHPKKDTESTKLEWLKKYVMTCM